MVKRVSSAFLGTCLRFFFFQAEDGIRDIGVTGVQTCALPIFFENPLVGAFVGPERLVERLELAPGMRVLDAGCGPGRLTIPLAEAVGPDGQVVALDGQLEMLEKLERRVADEGITNVRPLLAGLGEGALREGGFQRVVLAM